MAMSGGVDSSVAAYLTKEAGYQCVGMTMKLYDNEDVGLSAEHTCCSLDDVEDAREVCYRLGFPHYVTGLKEAFSCQVIDRFVESYERGDTPNPCIDCNRYMKFSDLYDKARMLGCEKIVTGHYARICFDEESGLWQLRKAKNLAKDQTYVLYFLTQEMLSHTLFPLGEFADKEEVRRLAKEQGFGNARKHDSQDICFVPDGDYAGFIRRRTGREYPPGDFVDTSGKVLGRHKGLIHYTIGQRRGLGLALPAPLYVKAKDQEKNQVILSPEPEIFSRELIAKDFHWICGQVPSSPVRGAAKTRYRSREGACEVYPLPDGMARFVFEEPQRAITTGQAVVLYDGDLVLGGGTIAEAIG